MLAEIRRLSLSYPAAENVSGLPGEDDESSENSHQIGSASTDIDLEHINRSLDHVNIYSKRRLVDKLPPVLMYEITSTGESCYKSITLRELLNDVNDEAIAVDEGAFLHFISGTTAFNPKRTDIKLDGDKDATKILEPKPSVPFQSIHPQRRSSLNPSGPGASKSLYETKYAPSDRVDRMDRAPSPVLDPAEPTYDATGSLRLRDLRRLDFQFNPNEERSVLIRRHAVLFAMDPIRAVVMAKRLILIVPDGADSLLSILDQYMKEWVSAKAASAAAENNRSTESMRQVQQVLQVLRTTDSAGAAEEGVFSHHPSGNSGASSIATSASGGSNTNLAGMGGLLRKLGTTARDSIAGHNDSPRPPQQQQQQQQQQAAKNAASTRHRTDYERRQFANATNNSQDLPFEMHAFEALLTTVMALETQEFHKVNTQVQVILNYFRSGSLLPIEVQEKMRNRKNDLSVMMRRISSARSTINELTEDDEEMALMSLSVLRDKPSLYHFPLVPEILSKHDDVEELLESYLIDFSTLESKIELMRNQIQNAEELLSLRLDTSRNELLIANTVLAILACCFGLGAYVSGIFGMNLDNTGKLQSTPNVFYTVIATSTGCMILMFVGMIYVFRHNGMFPAKIALHTRDAQKLKV